MFKLIHISDLHFSLVSYNPLQILSKRWIGNLNLMLFRKKKMWPEAVHSLIQAIEPLQPDAIFISGDFTSTALAREFDQGKILLQQLKKITPRLFAIPGNHDTYTKKAYQTKAFYHHFRDLIPFKGEYGYDLERDHVAAFLIAPQTYLLLIDAAAYTPYFQSNGIFSPTIERHLENLIEAIGPHSKMVMGCHFPFFQHESKRRVLIRGEKLQQIITRFSPQIPLYLHGHTHRITLCDLRQSQLPFLSDPGSLTSKNLSAFHLITLSDQHVGVTSHRLS